MSRVKRFAKKSKKKILIPILVVSLLVIAGAAYFAFSGSAAPTTYTPVPNGPGVSDTALLQGIINGAAAGDIIDLGGQTFIVEGALDINLSLQVLNGTIQLAPDSAMVPGAGAWAPWNVAKVNISSSDVTLGDPTGVTTLMINGFDEVPFGGGFAGSINVYVQGSQDNIVIDHCVINCGGNTVNTDAYDVGTGIITETGATVTNLTVSNSQINGDASGSGYPMYLNPGTDFTIDSNTFSGSFDGALVADSATGTISNNTFDQCAATGYAPPVPNSFIRLSNNSVGGLTNPSVSVTGNTFIPDPLRDPDTDPQFAVAVSSAVTSTDALTDFSNNDISSLMPDSSGRYPVINGTIDPAVIGKTGGNSLAYSENDSGVAYFGTGYLVSGALTGLPTASLPQTISYEDTTSGATGTTTTDADGNYSIAVTSGDTAVITAPTLAAYAVAPSTITIANIAADSTSNNFTYSTGITVRFNVGSPVWGALAQPRIDGFTVGDSIPEPPVTINRDRTTPPMTFVGWSTAILTPPATGQLSYGDPSKQWDFATDTIQSGNVSTVPVSASAPSGKVVDLRAIWGWTLKFDSQGGTVVADQAVADNYPANAPADPTRLGYAFTGWYTDATCTTKYDFATPVVGSMMTAAGDMTLYAGWDAKITVRYNVGSPTYGSAPTQVNGLSVGDPIPEPTINFNRNPQGMVFMGWTTALRTPLGAISYGDPAVALWDFTNDTIKASNVSTVPVQATAPSGQVVDLRALWGWTLTFNSEGGSAVASQTVADNWYAAAPSDPTKDYYTFGGWYQNDSYTGSAWDFTTDKVTANATLCAKWTPNVYNITYDFAGGLSAVAPPNKYTYGVGIPTLPTMGIVKQGYTFAGWVDGDGHTVTSITTTDHGDKALTAKWTANVYNITFNTDGGSSLTILPRTYTYGVGIRTLPRLMFKLGYTFGGWVDGDNNAVTSITTTDLGDKTLTAQWIPNVYNITFNANGGTLTDTPPSNYIYGVGIPTLPAAERTGYTFLGWYDILNRQVTSITTTDIGYKMLIARWSVNSYNITYNLNGGTNPIDAPASYTYGVGATLPVPTKAGYEFDGWFDNADFDGTAVTAITNTDFGDKEFWAQWTELPDVTITYTAVPSGGGILNRGSEDLAPATGVAQGVTITKFTPGYSFAGWYLASDTTFANRLGNDASFTPVKDSNGLNVAGDYIARFIEKPDVTITYYSGLGGSVDPTSESVAPATGDAQGSTATADPGYHFVNWTIGGSDGDEVSDQATFIPTTNSDGLNFAATYTANFAEDDNITITYVAGTGGSVDPTSESVAPATGDAQGSTATANKGYAFVNWTDANDKEVSTDATLTPAKVGGLNVAAVYTANFVENDPITINYDASTGGSVDPESETLAPVTDTAKGSVATADKGYKFVNWTNEDGNVVSTDETFIPDKADNLNMAATYTANFELITYEINYNLDGGTIADDAPKSYTFGTTVTLSIPDKDGNNFEGWYNASDFSGDEVKEILATDTGDKNFYAKWSEIPVTTTTTEESTTTTEESTTTDTITTVTDTTTQISTETTDTTTIATTDSSGSTTSTTTTLSLRDLLLKAVTDGKAMDLSQYTDDSAAAFNAALANGQAALDNPGATNNDFQAALDALTATKNGLVVKDTTVSTAATTTAPTNPSQTGVAPIASIAVVALLGAGSLVFLTSKKKKEK